MSYYEEAERSVTNIEWLKTLQKGDEVILSNMDGSVGNMIGNMFGGFFGGLNDIEKQICEIHKVFGRLPSDDPEHPEDFIVINIGGEGIVNTRFRIFNHKGKEIGIQDNNSNFSSRPSLLQPTDELRILSCRLKFINDVKTFPLWDKFDWQVILKIIELMNEETSRINDEELAIKEEQERKKKEDIEARTIGIISNDTSQIMESLVMNRQCSNCSRYKPFPEEKEDKDEDIRKDK